MLLEEALKTLLTDDAGVSAIVSSRVYPGFFPQTTEYPAVAYRQIGEDVTPTMTANNGHPGHAATRMRFYAAAKGIGNYLQAKRLDEALRLALHGYSDTIVSDSSPSDTLIIQGIFSENALDLPFDAETQTHQIVRDFAVWAVEPQPNH